MRHFDPTQDVDAAEFMQHYFPVSQPRKPGGADHFLQFIDQEVFPLIQSEYRSDPDDKTIIGHSSAGYFSLYVLFRQPQMFHRYVVASAWFPEDVERHHAEHRVQLPARLHLARKAAMKTISPSTPRLHVFERRDYEHFKLSHQIIPGCTHCAVVPSAFQAGLVAVFS